MDEVDKLKLLLVATRKETAIKQVELLRINSQINVTEAQLELLKIKAKELKDIIEENDGDVLRLTAKLCEHEKKLSEKPKDTPKNKASVNKETGESSQRSHPHWNRGNDNSDDEAAYAEIRPEEEEALWEIKGWSDYNEYEPYEYEMDSDLEDAILNRMGLD